MDKFWLESYEAGVPAEIDWTQYRSLTHLLEEAFHKYAARPAYACMDKSISFANSTSCRCALAAWLQSQGLQPRAHASRMMMPNVLQYPVAMAAVLRAGYAIVNVNPLYTPRELEHQLKDSGAEAIIVLENFAHHRAEGDAPEPRSSMSSSAAWATCSGSKGMIVNFVVRTRQEDGAGLVDSGRGAVQRRVLAGGARMKLKPAASATTTSPSCNTPAAPPACPRARCCCTATSSPTCCRTKPGSPDAGQAAGADQMYRLRAAAVPHLRADRVRPAGPARGRHEPADPQPARHPRLHQGAGQATASTSSRPSTRCTTAC